MLESLSHPNHRPINKADTSKNQIITHKKESLSKK